MPPPQAAVPEAEAIPLAVVYEDDDVIVIDKPAGLVVHPAAGNPTGTLVNALIPGALRANCRVRPFASMRNVHKFSLRHGFRRAP